MAATGSRSIAQEPLKQVRYARHSLRTRPVRRSKRARAKPRAHMTDPKPPERIFADAKVDAAAAKHVPSSPQTESDAYKLAFQDKEFLLRQDLRAVRFQLELLKPELLMNEANIASTFVFYGSARVPEPAKARALLDVARTDWDRTVAEKLDRQVALLRRRARAGAQGEPLPGRRGRQAPLRRHVGRRAVVHGSRQPRRAPTRGRNRSGSTSCCRTSNCPTPSSRRT